MSAVTCDREATTPQAKCNATLRAAVLFGAGFVAHSLQIASDMRLARASPAPRIPRRERHRIYAHQYLISQFLQLALKSHLKLLQIRGRRFVALFAWSQPETARLIEEPFGGLAVAEFRLAAD
jgi:hypothetical protein